MGDALNSNRFYAPGDLLLPMSQRRMQYDAAGNLTNDTYSGEGTRTYDTENHMKQAWANSQCQTYTYSAEGQRVRRSVNGTETWEVYGLGGEMMPWYLANGAPA